MVKIKQKRQWQRNWIVYNIAHKGNSRLKSTAFAYGSEYNRHVCIMYILQDADNKNIFEQWHKK